MIVDLIYFAVLIGFGYAGYVMGLARYAYLLLCGVLAFVLVDPVFSVIRGRFLPKEDLSLMLAVGTKTVAFVGVFIALMVVRQVIHSFLADQGHELSQNKPLGAVSGALQGGLAALVPLWMITYFFLRLVAQDDEMWIQVQLEDSKVVARADRYNPLNLFLLNKLAPYLPNEVTGRKIPQQRAPAPIARNENFKGLLSDTAFIESYKRGKYLSVIRNRSFHGFVKDRTLIDNLDKVAQDSDGELFDWENSAH